MHPNLMIESFNLKRCESNPLNQKFNSNVGARAGARASSSGSPHLVCCVRSPILDCESQFVRHN